MHRVRSWSWFLAAILLHWLAHPLTFARAAACLLGETTAGNKATYGDVLTLAVCQLWDPAQCEGCPIGVVLLTRVKWQFDFKSPPCPVTFEVSVVPTDHADCPKPDTTQSLCPPFRHVYAP